MSEFTEDFEAIRRDLDRQAVRDEAMRQRAQRAAQADVDAFLGNREDGDHPPREIFDYAGMIAAGREPQPGEPVPAEYFLPGAVIVNGKDVANGDVLTDQPINAAGPETAKHPKIWGMVKGFFEKVPEYFTEPLTPEQAQARSMVMPAPGQAIPTVQAPISPAVPRDVASGALKGTREVASALDLPSVNPFRWLEWMLAEPDGSGSWAPSPMLEGDIPQIDVSDPDNPVSYMVQAIAQFGLGYGPASAAIRIQRSGSWLARLGKLTAQESLRGGTAEMIAFDPDEGNLATMFREFGIENALVVFLDAADPEKTWPEQKLALFLEGAMVEAGFVAGATFIVDTAKGLARLAKSLTPEQLETIAGRISLMPAASGTIRSQRGQVSLHVPRVFRGEHGTPEPGQVFQTRSGSLTFIDDPEVASMYAMSPNLRSDVPQAPRVTPAYLDIRNPVIDVDDPFIDGKQLADAIGPEKSRQLLIKHENAVMNTNNWDENFSDYESVEALLKDRPELASSQDLYLDAHWIFDDADAVKAFKGAGYDGARYAGAGSGGTEYRVFDEAQIKDKPIPRLTETRISTAVPTTKTNIGRETSEYIEVGMPVMSVSHKATVANGVRSYTGFRTTAADAEGVLSDFKNFAKKNLRALYDAVPEDVRLQSKEWYVGANRIANDLASEYQIPLHNASAVIAALSPQKEWFTNVSLARRVIDIGKTKGNYMVDDAMRETANRIVVARPPPGWKKRFTPEQIAEKLVEKNAEKTIVRERVLAAGTLDNQRDAYDRGVWIRIYDETHNPRSFNTISPTGEVMGQVTIASGESATAAWGSFDEIANAVRALEASDMNGISEAVGAQHKIRNFFNNIADPDNETAVTIDTHAVAAALLRSLSGSSDEVGHSLGGLGISGDSGAKGSYAVLADAYRELASELGIKPRELQSITWEAIRGLMPSGNKAHMKVELDDLWHNAKTQEDAIDAIIGKGIRDPDWYKPSGGLIADGQPTGNAGQLPEPGGRAGGGVGLGDDSGLPGATAFGDEQAARTRAYGAVQKAATSRGAKRRDFVTDGSWVESPGSGGVGSRVLTLDPKDPFTKTLADNGYATPTYHKLGGAARKRAATFHEAITKSKEGHPFGYMVDTHTKTDYQKMQLFLTEDGSAGFAIDGDNIVSGFNTVGGPHDYIGPAMLTLAIQNGGRRLDCFDTVLPILYNQAGFRVVSRIPWDPKFEKELIAKGWDKAKLDRYNHGEPDVVMMIYDPQPGMQKDPYRPPPQYPDRRKTGPWKVSESWEEAEKIQRAAVAKRWGEN